MTVDEIGRLVEGSARTIDSSRVVSCKNGVLYLWATAPKLLEALEVMKIWGFKYKTHMIWDKERVGMGYWFRGRHELLLVGTCGKWSPPIASARVPSVLRYRSRRYKHSAKPPTVHEWIDEWWPDVVKVELFARERRKGWWTHGNEAVNR
jgi:N6-adenosine-specific RNA methylase IME4